MSATLRQKLHDHIPEDATVGVIIHAKGSAYRCVWYGLSAEQAAMHLYAVADEILRQRVPVDGSKH